MAESGPWPLAICFDRCRAYLSGAVGGGILQVSLVSAEWLNSLPTLGGRPQATFRGAGQRGSLSLSQVDGRPINLSLGGNIDHPRSFGNQSSATVSTPICLAHHSTGAEMDLGSFPHRVCCGISGGGSTSVSLVKCKDSSH
jgi:hypothetical protein